MAIIKQMVQAVSYQANYTNNACMLPKLYCEDEGETVPDKLIKSGHYRLADDGKVRSTYFSVLVEGPPLTGSYCHKGENNQDLCGTKPYPGYPRYYINPLVAGTVEDIQPGEHVTTVLLSLNLFPGELLSNWSHFVSYSGLNENVRIEKPSSPPIYVVDGHRFAYYAWEEALHMGYIDPGAVLIHIDAHYDAGNPTVKDRSENLGETARHVIDHLFDVNFIQPAVWKGTIRSVWFFRSKPLEGLNLSVDTKGYLLFPNRESIEASFLTKADLSWIISEISSPRQAILSVDIDALVVREKDLDRMPAKSDLERTMDLIADVAHRVGVVILATSPGYAEQKIAARVARQLVHKILVQND